MRSLSLILLCAFLAVPAAAQSERKAIGAFRKGFMASAKKPKDVQDRRQALRLLNGYDSKAVAQALVKGYDNLDEEVEALAARRIEIAEQISAMLASEEQVDGRIEKEDALITESATTRRMIDARLEVEVEMRDQIGQLRDEDAMEFLVDKVLRNLKSPVNLRLQVAKMCGSMNAETVPELERYLGRAKSPTDACLMLEAIGGVGRRASEASETIIKLLDNDSPVVRLKAARALSRIADANAIEPMIALLEREDGKDKTTVASYLEILTAQHFGANAGAWRAWWTAEGESYLAGRHELGKGVPETIELVDGADRYGRFYEILQDGKAMVYLIDASGSMSREVERRAGSGNGDVPSRLTACKAELIKGLGGLRSDQLFNVIWYNDRPSAFRPHPVPATQSEIEAAQDWIEKLQPFGSTNIYDTLKLSFSMCNHQHPGGRSFGICLDTVFLLTDGAPTTVDGKADSTERILAAVREWNALDNVTIHAIGIGQELNANFLREIASQNRGEFVHF